MSSSDKYIDIDTPYPILSRVEFMKRIHNRQEELKDSLEIHHDGLSVWTKTPSGKKLSRGCQTCKAGKWQCFFVGKKCNVDCIYCTQGTLKEKMVEPERPDLINDMYHIEDIKNVLNDPGSIWSGQRVQGIGYSGGEPFIYLDKVFNLAEFVSRFHGHIYQWIYTNGLLVTEDKLKALRDKGIKEIRFHIGATNFSEKVLKNIEIAKGIIDYVNVETPSTPELKKFLIDKKGVHRLEDIGVYQMNFGELSTLSLFHERMNKPGNQRMLKYFQKYQLYVYESVIGSSVTGMNLSQIYLSPTISRENTYDIMEYVLDNKIDILINDCSQDAKHIQRLQKTTNEHKTDILLNDDSQDDKYIQKRQQDIEERKLNLLKQHHRSQIRGCMKLIIQNINHNIV